MYYVAILTRAKLKPRIPRVSAHRLNAIHQTMRMAGVDTYDLGILWSDDDVAWAIYAFGEERK